MNFGWVLNPKSVVFEFSCVVFTVVRTKLYKIRKELERNKRNFEKKKI